LTIEIDTTDYIAMTRWAEGKGEIKGGFLKKADYAG
jgi:hypothetical protein